MVALLAVVGWSEPDRRVFEMTIEELIDVRVASPGALTKARGSRVPASVTHISTDQIRESGARSLDELLEIYVPNFQRARQGGSGPHFGMRGIISDLDNKTLLLVNGREMNHRSVFGAFSERYLPLLGDIASIDVIRGAGSSIYGPGAINGVISIETYTSRTFEGAEMQLRQGVVETFSAGELRLGFRDKSGDRGAFLYVGIDDYSGASPEDSPLVFSKDAGALFSAGEGSDKGFLRDNGARGGKPQHKAHLHAHWGDTEVWLRSVSGSVEYLNVRHVIEAEGTLATSRKSGSYQHLTLGVRHERELSDTLTFRLEAGGDVFDASQGEDRLDYSGLGYSDRLALRESELQARALLSWTPSERHSFAWGGTWSHEWIGRRATLLSSDAPHIGPNAMPSWETDAFGVFGEYQWNFDPAWTLFLGGRADWHEHAGWAYSPKAAVSYESSDVHRWRLMFNRSVRRSETLELLRQDQAGQEPELETIDAIELRHDWRPRQGLSIGTSAFWYRHEILGFSIQQLREAPMGTSYAAGLEFEIDWREGNHQIGFSHAYTKLLNFELHEDTLMNQVVTAEPYGYGDDFANWSPHLSKIHWRWQATDRLSTTASMRLYWGFPGAEDYTAYNNEVLGAGNRSQSNGITKAFRHSAFLNAGCQYRLNDHARIGFNLYNVLGWVDKDLNKRNFYARMAGYRSEAAAAAVSLEVRF